MSIGGGGCLSLFLAALGVIYSRTRYSTIFTNWKSQGFPHLYCISGICFYSALPWHLSQELQDFSGVLYSYATYIQELKENRDVCIG